YEYDKETKQYYLKARYYDPKIARFLSEDSYRGDRKDPLSLNLYTYCHNEPIMYVDLDGHAPQKQARGDKTANNKNNQKKGSSNSKGSKQNTTTKSGISVEPKDSGNKKDTKKKPAEVNKKKATNNIGSKEVKKGNVKKNTSSQETKSAELQDKDILSKEDLAIIVGLKRMYVTRVAMNDNDGAKALLRTIDVIRSKPEYKGMYDSKDKNGNYVSKYKYSNSEISTKVNVHAHTITKGNFLAHDGTIVNGAVTAGSILLPKPYCYLVGLIGMGTASDSTDLVLGAAGMIDPPVGAFFSVIGGVKTQLNQEVKVGDIEVAISLSKDGDVNTSTTYFSKDFKIKSEYHDCVNAPVPANWKSYDDRYPTPDIVLDTEYYKNGNWKGLRYWFK
ncbi:RHS repeat-associated core domain-containing protein, partial [Fervidicella metallireducens]|uniref:RHS repeat-associated core domain-containing protein n=1 Tax=Fervidicella metallireducens TaxID=655338 RepID=UPI0005573F75